MADFDPYRKWLGIPPEEQPPHHYRLLGVGLFESDPDVIANAADRQMAHVRTFQSGQNAVASQQILNELASARVCLLDPQKRALYDAALKLKQPAVPVAAVPVAAVPVAAVPPGVAAPPQAPPPGSPPQAPPPPHVPPPPGRVASPVAPSLGAPAGRGAAPARSYPSRRRSQNWQIPVIVFGVVAVVGLGLALMVIMDGENGAPETQPPPQRTPLPDLARDWSAPRPERPRPKGRARAELPTSPSSTQPPFPVQGFTPLGPARLGEIAAMPGHTGPVLSSAFSPDGLFAATGGQDATVRLWDPVAGRQLRQLPDASDPVLGLTFSRDGRFVYALAGPTNEPGGAICVWDVGLGGKPEVIPVAEGRQVQSLAVDPKGELAAVGCHDGSIRLIDLNTQAELRAFSGHVGPVHAVAFSHDGAAVVSGGEDGAVLAFHRNTGAEVRRFAGHRGPVRAVAIAPDGTDAASAATTTWSASGSCGVIRRGLSFAGTNNR